MCVTIWRRQGVDKAPDYHICVTGTVCLDNLIQFATKVVSALFNNFDKTQSCLKVK